MVVIMETTFWQDVVRFFHEKTRGRPKRSDIDKRRIRIIFMRFSMVIIPILGAIGAVIVKISTNNVWNGVLLLAAVVLVWLPLFSFENWYAKDYASRIEALDQTEEW